MLDQTYQNLEVIVVDDCSTDNTKSVLERIQDPRLRYIRLKKNSGACTARNRGINEAKGDFIAFQDSDDEWSRDKIELQIKRLLESGADFCFCRMKTTDTQNGIQGYIPDDETEKNLTYERLLIGNYISTQMLLIKKECLEHIRFDESMPRYQDWDLVLSLTKKYKMVYEPKTLVNQYIQCDSISRSNLKLAKATQQILIKYEKDFLTHKAAYIKMLKDVSRNMTINNMDAIYYYKKLFSVNKSLKSALKIVLYKLHILQLYYKIKFKKSSGR